MGCRTGQVVGMWVHGSWVSGWATWEVRGSVLREWVGEKVDECEGG